MYVPSQTAIGCHFLVPWFCTKGYLVVVGFLIWVDFRGFIPTNLVCRLNPTLMFFFVSRAPLFIHLKEKPPFLVSGYPSELFLPVSRHDQGHKLVSVVRYVHERRISQRFHLSYERPGGDKS
jgi:hypothetical protein